MFKGLTEIYATNISLFLSSRSCGRHSFCALLHNFHVLRNCGFLTGHSECYDTLVLESVRLVKVHDKATVCTGFGGALIYWGNITPVKRPTDLLQWDAMLT